MAAPPGLEPGTEPSATIKIALHLKSLGRKNKLTFTMRLYLVAPPGLEPGTQGSSGLCSTN